MGSRRTLRSIPKCKYEQRFHATFNGVAVSAVVYLTWEGIFIGKHDMKWRLWLTCYTLFRIAGEMNLVGEGSCWLPNSAELSFHGRGMHEIVSSWSFSISVSWTTNRAPAFLSVLLPIQTLHCLFDRTRYPSVLGSISFDSGPQTRRDAP